MAHPYVESTRAVAVLRIRDCLDALHRIDHYTLLHAMTSCDESRNAFRREYEEALSVALKHARRALAELERAEALEVEHA